MNGNDDDDGPIVKKVHAAQDSHIPFITSSQSASGSPSAKAHALCRKK